MFKKLFNTLKENDEMEIKIEIFDFEKDWNLVEPHLDDPKLLKLLNKAMRRFSIRHKPMNLPIWDPTDDIGPWKYEGRPCVHEQRAVCKASAEEEVLTEEYKQICENENLEFEATVFSKGPKNLKAHEISKAFNEESSKIVNDYLPKKNTYKWYQCYTAGNYLKKWQLQLQIQLILQEI